MISTHPWSLSQSTGVCERINARARATYTHRAVRLASLIPSNSLHARLVKFQKLLTLWLTLLLLDRLVIHRLVVFQLQARPERLYEFTRGQSSSSSFVNTLETIVVAVVAVARRPRARCIARHASRAFRAIALAVTVVIRTSCASLASRSVDRKRSRAFATRHSSSCDAIERTLTHGARAR